MVQRIWPLTSTVSAVPVSESSIDRKRMSWTSALAVPANCLFYPPFVCRLDSLSPSLLWDEPAPLALRKLDIAKLADVRGARTLEMHRGRIGAWRVDPRW